MARIGASREVASARALREAAEGHITVYADHGVRRSRFKPQRVWNRQMSEEFRKDKTMAARVEGRHGTGTWVRAMARWRRVAWVVILIADVGLLAWCAMAALAPGRLAGPGETPILTAGYEGFTGGSWQELVATSPKTTEYATLLFRMYGIYGVGLSVLAIAIAASGFRRGERWAWWALLVGNTIGYGAAMVYDQIVGAVGPFELTEYLGLAAIYGSLAITAPFPHDLESSTRSAGW